MKKKLNLICGFIVVILLVACTDKNATIIESEQTVTAIQGQELSLTVYKSESCGCCEKWITHLHEHSINTEVVNVDNMGDIKSQYKIKPNQRSCHTAVSSDGFVFEGHVPAKFIKRFLLEEHEQSVFGLTVPAMPIGTPGMEMDDRFNKYDIELLSNTADPVSYERVNHYHEQF